MEQNVQKCMSCKFDMRKALTAGALKTPVKVSEQSTLPELGCKTDGCRDVWYILINAVCIYSDPIPVSYTHLTLPTIDDV